MPTFQFEAMDATGMEIKDTIVSESEEEAQATIRQMGYFVTKIGRKRDNGKPDAPKLATLSTFSIHNRPVIGPCDRSGDMTQVPIHPDIADLVSDEKPQLALWVGEYELSEWGLSDICDLLNEAQHEEGRYKIVEKDSGEKVLVIYQWKEDLSDEEILDLLDE